MKKNRFRCLQKDFDQSEKNFYPVDLSKYIRHTFWTNRSAYGYICTHIIMLTVSKPLLVLWLQAVALVVECLSVGHASLQLLVRASLPRARVLAHDRL